jgi:molecular chaperone Hsp33
VFRDAAVSAECSCSRENVSNMLKSFSQDDRDHMVENGQITVTCEFCNSTYVFEPEKLAVEETSDEPPANKPLN